MSEVIKDEPVDDGNLQVPPELVIDILIKKNAQLALENATLQAGFTVLQEQIKQLKEKK